MLLYLQVFFTWLSLSHLPCAAFESLLCLICRGGGAGSRMPCFALQLSLYCFYPLPLATGVLGEVCTAFLLFRSNKF